MKIIIGADHGGFEMKEKIKKWLLVDGYKVEDVGAENQNLKDDFVDYAKKAVERFQQSQQGLVLLTGVILFCRNGVGMDIVANRFANIRCVLGFDTKQVRRARNDDDVNCLALPSDYIDFKKTKELIKVFLETKFSKEERFMRRLKKIKAI